MVGEVWVCEDCGFHFGMPVPDPSEELDLCPYCGSSNIKVIKK